MAPNVDATDRENTPVRDPSKQPSKITATQKQALLHNLQLEITERARKLRAQYALHAQGLRSRLDMRINRIPQSLRSTNILELVDTYASQSEVSTADGIATSKARPMPRADLPSLVRPATQALGGSQRARGKKRSSNEMSTTSDKENAGSHEDLSLPKKRTKTAMSTQSKGAATSGVARKVHPSQVLSPKSHNSRTLPRSPLKSQASSPPKSQIARPTSPLKPGPAVSAATAALAGMVDATAGSRPGSRPNTATSNSSSATSGSLRGARGAGKTQSKMLPPPVPAKSTRTRTASNSSNTSNTSSGTTVVKKKVGAKASATATIKKTLTGAVAGKNSAAQKKTAAATKKAAAAPAVSATGRALRTRK